MRISDWSSDVCSSDLPTRPSRSRARGIAVALPSGPYSSGADALCAARRSHEDAGRILRPTAPDPPGRPRMTSTPQRPVDARVAFRRLMAWNGGAAVVTISSEEHTLELQSLSSNSYAV